VIGNYAQKAISLAVNYNISIYDAAYVALTGVLEVHAYSADKILVKNVQKKYGEKFFFITKLEKNERRRSEHGFTDD
jgi:predicted nucleic acid-binding protein